MTKFDVTIQFSDAAEEIHECIEAPYFFNEPPRVKLVKAQEVIYINWTRVEAIWYCPIEEPAEPVVVGIKSGTQG